ncbi:MULTISPECIES: LysR family transcriptional regulator [unclassified Rhizobium]|uniref:LysR family transcriptional regulator n=1 Tax=unclassified Rhizobium TaxID=2613769 RepID=UPI0006FF2FC7|nr:MULTISPECIES: LysR family transcriptional regulator [unclassified Rhizobium]KQV43266.1 LysR family transcriptional regulator [Rhizobium sp. Root1212]KRD37451.1 LysR family transcriptional regulator [Rhizobium sp. Root268]
MEDLNDLALFAAVVKHKGFSAAARCLNIPKSKLSKHVARLEQQLGVRLLERSTRKLRVTEIGQAFYERCETVLASVDAARAVVEAARSEPAGVVRLGCPIGFTPMMAAVLPAFHRRYPAVRVLVHTTNRRIDLVEERIDIALRARDELDGESHLIVRKLGEARRYLAASPAFLARHGEITIDNIGDLPTLSMNEMHPTDTWQLLHRDGMKRDVSHMPVIGCGDFVILERAAIEGVGIALLPDHLCERGFRAGTLAPVLPDWSSGDTIVHLAFTSRHGILPAVRALIDFIAEALPAAMSRCREVPSHPAVLPPLMQAAE